MGPFLKTLDVVVMTKNSLTQLRKDFQVSMIVVIALVHLLTFCLCERISVPVYFQRTEALCALLIFIVWLADPHLTDSPIEIEDELRMAKRRLFYHRIFGLMENFGG